MSAHQEIRIHALIKHGDTQDLLAELVLLRAAGHEDAARFLVRTAHRVNKAARSEVE